MQVNIVITIMTLLTEMQVNMYHYDSLNRNAS